MNENHLFVCYSAWPPLQQSIGEATKKALKAINPKRLRRSNPAKPSIPVAPERIEFKVTILNISSILIIKNSFLLYLFFSNELIAIQR